jgi:hypothetical protein
MFLLWYVQFNSSCCCCCCAKSSFNAYLNQGPKASALGNEVPILPLCENLVYFEKCILQQVPNLVLSSPKLKSSSIQLQSLFRKRSLSFNLLLLVIPSTDSFRTVTTSAISKESINEPVEKQK